MFPNKNFVVHPKLTIIKPEITKMSHKQCFERARVKLGYDEEYFIGVCIYTKSGWPRLFTVTPPAVVCLSQKHYERNPSDNGISGVESKTGVSF